MSGIRTTGLSIWLAALLLAGAAAGPVAAAPSGRTLGWETYANARYGFSIAYPPGLFKPSGAAENESGRLLVTADGRARLLIGALPNTDGLDLRTYRDFVKSETYPGARIDYAPVGRNWFVLSGTRGDDHFYQWVTLVCGGRVINSWAMTYPDAERRRYDPIVAPIAKTFKPGVGQLAESGSDPCR